MVTCSNWMMAVAVNFGFVEKKYTYRIFICLYYFSFFFCASFDRWEKRRFSHVGFIIRFFISFNLKCGKFRKYIAEKKRFVRWTVCISIRCIMHGLKRSIAFAKENIPKRLAYKQLKVSFVALKLSIITYRMMFEKTNPPPPHPSLFICTFFHFSTHSRMVYIRSGAEQCKRQRFSILRWFINGFGWWLGSLCCIGLSWVFAWNPLLGIHHQQIYTGYRSSVWNSTHWCGTRSNAG